jgi:putative transposase
MRHAAAEKLEIIHLVERSWLSPRRTLAQLGIPHSRFYAWYDRYVQGGPEGLEDRKPRPRQVWNKVPEAIADALIELALESAELSPRELAVSFTEQRRYFLSEATVYRLLKAKDLITSPAYILMKASDRFSNPTTAVNQLWQTDFTYFKVIGWGWFYLSTVLDDLCRYILAWKLCTSMTATDVSDTLDIALAASGLNQVKVRTVHPPLQHPEVPRVLEQPHTRSCLYRAWPGHRGLISNQRARHSLIFKHELSRILCRRTGND